MNKIKTNELKMKDIFMFYQDYEDDIRILYADTDDIKYLKNTNFKKFLECFKTYCGDILEIANWSSTWYINPKKIYKAEPYTSFDNDEVQTDLYGCKARNLANEFDSIRIHMDYRKFMKTYGHLLTFIKSSI
jgi:hypothetical protein